MTHALWVFRTLLSHWRRNPLQIGAITLGLVLATALWSGVQAINAEARSSYAKSAAMFGGDTVSALVPQSGDTMPQSHFAVLRRAGINVSPMVEGALILGERRHRIVGIEPISMPIDAAPDALSGVDRDDVFADFLSPPWQVIAAPETISYLSNFDTELPPLRADPTMLPDLLITDIGVAQRLLDRRGVISRLVLSPEAEVSAEMSARLGLRLDAPAAGDEIGGLTDSFHLNLTAFSLLAFIVGLFIVHSAIGLATEQRLSMFRTLRTCGVSARVLMVVLLGELIVLAALAGAIGVIGGYIIAGALLPDVASSLRGLYGVSVSGSLSLSPAWWLSGIGMSIAGALIAAVLALRTAYCLPVLASAQPEAWRQAQDRVLSRCRMAACVLIAAACVGYGFGNSLVAGFATMACALLAAAVALPVVLDLVLRIGVRRAKTPLGLWAWSDMRQQLSGLSLALMALLLALSANIGVGTMVGGFRLTFLSWLDQRLAAEIYVRGADEDESQRLHAWARAHPSVTAVLPTRQVETTIDGALIEVVSIVDDATYRDIWPILSGSAAAWDRLYEGTGSLLSEQAAHRLGVSVGEDVALGDQEIKVVGTYADYGNPKGQMLVSFEALAARFETSTRQGTGLRLDPTQTEALMAEITAEFDLPPDRMIDQKAVKALATEVFEKTFAITSALNVLTLAVAGAALFASMLTLADRRLPALAPIWGMGVSRRRLAWIEMLKTLGMAGLTALVAVPLGVLLAWLLVAVINVHAFGWRLPLHVFPAQWLGLGVLSVGVAGLAAALPIARLQRIAPAHLLKVFSNAR